MLLEMGAQQRGEAATFLPLKASQNSVWRPATPRFGAGAGLSTDNVEHLCGIQRIQIDEERIGMHGPGLLPGCALRTKIFKVEGR